MFLWNERPNSKQTVIIVFGAFMVHLQFISYIHLYLFTADTSDLIFMLFFVVVFRFWLIYNKQTGKKVEKRRTKSNPRLHLSREMFLFCFLRLNRGSNEVFVSIFGNALYSTDRITHERGVRNTCAIVSILWGN